MDAPTPSPGPRPDPEELRIGLVLNGGVSLAVWIGGVTHEIDRLRRAGTVVARRGGPEPVRDADVTDDLAPYIDALDRAGLRSGARVDVIAGASAGGINGAVLAAAVQGTRIGRDDGRRVTELRAMATADGEPLRRLWLDLGDLRGLTRSPRESEPPSLLRGDELMVPALTGVLAPLLAPSAESRPGHPVHLHITATDLRGERRVAFPTDSGRRIRERDHRVVFRFSGGELDPADRGLPAERLDGLGLRPPAMAEDVLLEPGNAERLARAARASSSFPGAFPPHRVDLLRRGEGWGDTRERTVPVHLVDGGILDNQPLRPVLERVTAMPVSAPWKRVILYVVPYVTEEPPETWTPRPPSVVEAISAGGLARGLPKLESLRRVEEARRAGRAPLRIPGPADPAARDLVASAERLLPLYRDAYAAELRDTVEGWRAAPPGTESDAGPPPGRDAPDPPSPADAGLPVGPEDLVPRADWLTTTRVTVESLAGLGPAALERMSFIALGWAVAPPPGAGDAAPAREAASLLTVAARRWAVAVRARFTAALDATPADMEDPGERSPHAALRAFTVVYRDALVPGRGSEAREAATAAIAAVRLLARLHGVPAVAVLRALVAVEVVSRALGDPPPRAPEFSFLRVSAEGEVLGNTACTTPGTKLAGMQLGHFAAFLKRSWRANDWMWGRLDGIAVLGRILQDLAVTRDPARERPADWDLWVRRRQLEVLRDELHVVAAAIVRDEEEGFSRTSAASRWRRDHAPVLARLADDTRRGTVTDEELLRVFRAWDLDPAGLVDDELGARATVARVTRMAAVASQAFSGAASGLPGPVRAVVAATRGTTRAAETVSRTVVRAPLLGIALLIVFAALAAVLAASDVVGASLLVPALVGAAVAGAWIGYGYLSSPPTVPRAVVLTAALLGLVAAVLLHGRWDAFPDVGDDPSVLWAVPLPVVAALTAVLVALGDRRWRRVLGLVLLGLLAAWLVRLGIDAVDDRADRVGTVDAPWWEDLFLSRELLLTVLVLGVAATILSALAEVLLPVWTWARARTRARGRMSR